jgi:hydroxymethylpyrimidine kinase/phosphomethylpyrimidine kinase
MTEHGENDVEICLTVAGTDSGGGAGIAADLQTFAAHGCHGTLAVTAVTAQSTVGVTAVHPVPPQIVAAQLDAVLEDLPAAAAKTGMLLSAGVIEVVADRLAAHRVPHLVVDPVMIASTGAPLLEADAVATLRRVLLPLCEVVTPNLPEAEVLAGAPVATEDERLDAARRILELGPRFVVVKGGHGAGPAVDLVVGPGGEVVRLEAPRLDTRATHGTGCTFSAALAAGLARGRTVAEAARDAKAYVRRAMETAVPLGAGPGPLRRWW